MTDARGGVTQQPGEPDRSAEVTSVGLGLVSSQIVTKAWGHPRAPGREYTTIRGSRQHLRSSRSGVSGRGGKGELRDKRVEEEVNDPPLRSRL